MTYESALAYSLSRSILLSAVGVVLSQMIYQAGNPGGRRNGVRWALLLTPLFTPTLVLGYAYRDTSLSLVHHPGAREALYCGLTLARSVGVGVVILLLAPRPRVSAAALHVRRLSHGRDSFWWRLQWQARVGRELQVFSVLFLLIFQEAELAALLQAPGWPEWLVTRHAGGLPIQESWRLVLWPVAIQLLAATPVWIWLQQLFQGWAPLEAPREARRGVQCLANSWLLLAFSVASILPLVQIIRGARQGWPAVWRQSATWRELSDAGLLAATAAALAMGLLWLAWPRASRRTSPSTWPRRWAFARTVFWISLWTPGLLGSLVLGLSLGAIVHTPGLQWAYDTSWPLIVGEALLILPRLGVLAVVLAPRGESSGEHWRRALARSTDVDQQRGATELWWRRRVRAWSVVFFLGAYWVYFDALLPALLAPPGMAPVGWVLYNSLHYGRIAVLGSKLALALLAPGVCVGLFWGWRRLRHKLRWS